MVCCFFSKHEAIIWASCRARRRSTHRRAWHVDVLHTCLLGPLDALQKGTVQVQVRALGPSKFSRRWAWAKWRTRQSCAPPHRRPRTWSDACSVAARKHWPPSRRGAAAPRTPGHRATATHRVSVRARAARQPCAPPPRRPSAKSDVCSVAVRKHWPPFRGAAAPRPPATAQPLRRRSAFAPEPRATPAPAPQAPKCKGGCVFGCC